MILTTANTFMFETIISPRKGLIMSIIVSLILMVLPELMFSVRYLITGSDINHIASVNTLDHYDLIIKIIIIVDVLVLCVVVGSVTYAFFE